MKRNIHICNLLKNGLVFMAKPFIFNHLGKFRGAETANGLFYSHFFPVCP